MSQIPDNNTRQLQAFYELADIILLSLDRQGTITDINTNGAAMMGWSRDELIGRNWLETCLSKSNRSRIKAVFNRFIGGETQLNEYFQNAVVTRTGQEKTLSWHNMAWRNDANDIVGTYSIGIDVTQRVLAEQKEKALGDILENSFSEALVVDVQSLKISHANKSALKNLGYTLDKIKGLSLLDVIHIANQAEVKRSIDSLTHTEQDTATLDGYLVRRDKSTYPAEVHLQLNHYDSVLSLVVISLDLTDRHEAQRALLVSELRYRAIFNAAVDAIITCELDGTITSLNRAAEKIFGYRAEELIRDKLDRLLPTLTEQQRAAIVKSKALENSSPAETTALESTALHKNGTDIPVEISISEVVAEHLQFLMVIVRDLSESKRVEKQLVSREEEMQQLREQLLHMDRLHIVNEMASGVAHEVNQPLTAISNYANACLKLLNQPNFKVKKIRAAAEHINQQALRAAEIIRMLRNLMKKHSSKYERVDLVKLVREAVELCRSNIVGQRIAITTKLATAPLYVEADAIQIQQVLLNLLNNCIDALLASKQSHKSISVQIEPLAREIVRVSVRDNGPGVPTDIRGRLFEPFVTNKSDGLGLGLSICRSVITGHGGELQFNADYNGGAEFYFDLPRVDATKNEDINEFDEAIL